MAKVLCASLDLHALTDDSHKSRSCKVWVTVQDNALRTLASLQRAKRLADGYAEAQLAAFAERARKLGDALGMPHDIKTVFTEAEIRCGSPLPHSIGTQMRSSSCLVTCTCFVHVSFPRSVMRLVTLMAVNQDV